MRVGIAVLGSAIGISSTEGRDRLVKDLNKQKKVPLEAVPIQGISGNQISAEAREKNCEFVVFPTVVDAQKQGQVQRSDGGIATDVPNFHASLEYKVYRVSDSTLVASGKALAQGIGSQGEIVSEALDSASGKIAAALKSAVAAAPPPTP